MDIDVFGSRLQEPVPAAFASCIRQFFLLCFSGNHGLSRFLKDADLPVNPADLCAALPRL
ncbi:MAG: hypothetical protein OXC53_06020 [Rhodobacteraceae bacterium]|nr:hypothetical protein [Paracoccaceae bacterium]